MDAGGRGCLATELTSAPQLGSHCSTLWGLGEHANEVVEIAGGISPGNAEFETLLGTGEVIEETVTEDGNLKELVLLLDWTRPLHVVVIVDDERAEERIITVYEPDPDSWSNDYRRRR